MKKIFSFIMVAMMAVAMYAQSPVKLALRPSVGVAISNWSYNTTIAEAKANAGFTAGVDLEIGLLGIFKPSIGVNYAYQTAGTKDFNGVGQMYETGNLGDFKLQTFNVPVLANFDFIGGLLRLKAGIMPSWAIGSRLGGSGIQSDTKTTFYIPVGASVNLGKFSIDARYHFACNKTIDFSNFKVENIETGFKGDYRAEYLTVTVGYRMDLLK